MRFKTRWSTWSFVAICATVMTVATSLPYLFGYVICPVDKAFMGMTRGDVAQYMAWIRGFTRANLIDNHLTPEPNAAVFFNLLWWVLAKLTVITSLGPIAVIHLYRLSSIVFFAVVLYWYIGLCMPNQQQRRGAFLVAYFGGGLGWIWVVEKYISGRGDTLFPRDLYKIEANSFWSLMGINHFTFSAALMILIYAFFLLGYERRQWRYPLLASLAAVVLGWEHAYDLLLVYAVLGVFVFILLIRDGLSWHLVAYPLLIGLSSVWAPLYSLYITRTFPIWKAVLNQFQNAQAWTPDPLHLLILLGLPFIVALFAFDGLVPLKKRSLRDLLVRVWFGVNLFVVYVPLSFQGHYLSGWQVPIAILAASAFFERILPWARQGSLYERLGLLWSSARLEKVVLSLALLAVALVNVYMFMWRFTVLARLPHAHFLGRDEAVALDWLAENTTPDDVVLSAIEVGQYIPSRTGARPFLAHWAMTKDVFQKQEMVERFFNSATPDAERQAILRTFGVDYVLVGVEERSLGDYDPASAVHLEACFTRPQATVYRVREDRLSQTGR